MALSFTDGPVVSDILPPKNSKPYALRATCLGPVAVADTSQGVGSYTWRGVYEGVDLRVRRDGSTGSTLLPIGRAGVTFLDFTFDVTGREIIIYAASGKTYIYWYDPTIPGYTELEVNSEETECFCDLDIKRSGGKVILSYRRGTGVYTRLSSDRYTTEQQVEQSVGVPLAVTQLVLAGFTVDNRFQWCGDS